MRRKNPHTIHTLIVCFFSYVSLAGRNERMRADQLEVKMKESVFINGLGDQDSIPSWVIPKTQNMVFDAALLDTQHYKVRIKGKVEQSRE